MHILLWDWDRDYTYIYLDNIIISKIKKGNNSHYMKVQEPGIRYSGAAKVQKCDVSYKF